jgi:NaMN:DMB phosphoribosyltransferase
MRSKLIGTVRGFRWHQWLVVGVFLLVAGFTTYKAVNMARRMIYWQTHHDEPIHGWMNVGYVAHSYRIQPDVLYLALDLPQTPDKRPLRDIAKVQHRSMDDIRTILQSAIIRTRSSNPHPLLPPNPSPDSGRSP